MSANKINRSRRVLLKLSGEALSAPNVPGIDDTYLQRVATEIAEAAKQGVQIAIVLGAGNFIRGATIRSSCIENTTADQMGMLGTVLNALALQDALKARAITVSSYSAIAMPSIMPPFDHRAAQADLAAGKVVICAGGTGNPFVTTDSAASLRAIMLQVDCILKATKVDGVYDKDPNKHSDAKRYTSLTFDEALQKELGVMDLSAFLQCRDYNISIRVFDMSQKEAITRALLGEPLGTLVKRG